MPIKQRSGGPRAVSSVNISPHRGAVIARCRRMGWKRSMPYRHGKDGPQPVLPLLGLVIRGPVYRHRHHKDKRHEGTEQVHPGILVGSSHECEYGVQEERGREYPQVQLMVYPPIIFPEVFGLVMVASQLTTVGIPNPSPIPESVKAIIMVKMLCTPHMRTPPAMKHR